jgi:bacillopeptidase F
LWAAATNYAHGGSKSLTDSPSGSYPNSSDTAATLKMIMPDGRCLMSFWHRYAFEQDSDFGWIQVSKDNGANWTTIYMITGQSGTNWEKVTLDLTEYANQQTVIRFRLTSDGSINFDGWYIDDLEIRNYGATANYPFFDN